MIHKEQSVGISEWMFEFAKASDKAASALYNLGISIAPSLARGLIQSGMLISPNPFMYSAYARWYNTSHPNRKVSRKRLSRQQREEAMGMWASGMLNVGYLPQKYKRMRGYAPPEKPKKRPLTAV